MIGSTKTRPLVILLEHNPTWAILLKEFLEDYFSVVAAANFEEARRVAAQREIAFVILPFTIESVLFAEESRSMKFKIIAIAESSYQKLYHLPPDSPIDCVLEKPHGDKTIASLHNFFATLKQALLVPVTL